MNETTKFILEMSPLFFLISGLLSIIIWQSVAGPKFNRQFEEFFISKKKLMLRKLEE